MGMVEMGDDSPGAKSVLQKFTPARWAAVRSAYPGIEDLLRRACNIVGNQLLFDAAGRPTGLLTARLQRLTPQGAAALLDAIEVIDDAADDTANHDDEKDTESNEDTERAATDGDLVVAARLQAPAELAARLDSLQRLIDELRERQGPALAALDRIRTQVELGKLGAADDMA